MTYLKELRERYRFSEDDLADALGVSVEDYLVYESGNLIPIDTLERLSEIYMRTADEIARKQLESLKK